jgi:uncharacterized protein YdcH (DUF465 family)
MTLQNDAELANTREKLNELEKRYQALQSGAEPDVRLRDLSMKSLKHLIIQLKGEIARYEARHAIRR